jgi:hypothetical protein
MLGADASRPTWGDARRGGVVSRRRRIAARSLVVLGALVAVVALLAAYVRWQALDTDTFEKTSGELIQDPVVRDQIAATMVDKLFGAVDVQAEVANALPEAQAVLAGPIAAGVRELADRAAHQLLERPRAQELWVAATVQTQRQLVRLLDGDTTVVQSGEGGAVVLNLRPLVIQLGERVAVVSAALSRLPADAGVVTVLEASQLETAQTLTHWLDVLGAWLFVIPLLLWAAAIWIAKGRRRIELRAVAFAALIAGLLTLVIRAVAGRIVVDKLATTESVRPAVENTWTTLTDLLSQGAWTLIGVGLVALLGAWLAGPGGWATGARGALAPSLARWEIAYGTLVVLIALLVWWGPTDQTQRPGRVLLFGLIAALGLEALRRIAAREFPDAAERSPTEPFRGLVGRSRASGPD